jgi:NAD(P)-dependent dehydrogenase (short-subunit alcohol dehydrogenase family)
MSKVQPQVRPKGTVKYENHGRVVLITGGCNGIGWAICDGFASSGATVVCADVADELANQLPAGVAFRHVDTSLEEQCREVIAWTVENFGALDVLVNNAAIQPKASYTSVDQLDSAELERMTRVNFFGYTFMAKYALAQMRQQQSGVVVNLSSGQGHRTARQVPVYGPIKAANLLQAMQWGVEFARDGIRVVSVSPGAIDTPLVRASLAAQGGEAALANRHPLGRIGRPEEIANAVLWLTSGDASFVTATDLEVDGGLGAFGAFAEPYQQQ